MNFVFDTMTITIIFIVVATVLGIFLKGRSRDRCLKDFARYMITLENKAGKSIWGTLRVETTGLELTYPEKHTNSDGNINVSYILYKSEFGTIQALVRLHEQLTDPNKKHREKTLKQTYHPSIFRRMRRNVRNFFNTVRDSVMEISTLLIGQAKKSAAMGKMISSQDKHVSRMQKDVVSSTGTAFEPLMERHIGRRVVLELKRGDQWVEYSGVLKDYTAEFVEILDVDYATAKYDTPRKADLVVPRPLAFVRHLGE